MLERIGLRGTNWAIDASHCQGCSSQFTFINRKHHCRRCEGIFCNSCSQQRMVLRGQGDSSVRVCEPCKKLEEAARFESTHGYKSRAGRGSSKSAVKDEDDDILNQVLGADGKESSSSGLPSVERETCSATYSNVQVVVGHDGGGEIHKSQPVDQSMQNDMASPSPEKLRQQALDEKRKYKVLKGEGKSEEALRAFKRGKELEKQAESLETHVRKIHKKSSPFGQNKEVGEESDRTNKVRHDPVGRDKGDLAAELRELGWSNMDLRDDDKRSTNLSLDGELSSLLGDAPKKINGHGTDKTQVVAIKKKALILKREGKLAEAKEELKRAKVLEKQLEEQELLAGAEDSDDELSAMIHNMDNDKKDESLMQYEPMQNLDFDHLVGIADDLGIDSNFEVTDQDMEDPEIAATLKSLGWSDDSNPIEDVIVQSSPVKREALLNEILTLKREALSEKRAGNVAEAMAQLKKAKLLEKDLESFDSQTENLTVNRNIAAPLTVVHNVNASVELKPKSKSRLMIQKELLSLKKKALALRREGRVNEVEEELQKGRILKQQLEEMEKAAQVTVCGKGKDSKHEHPNDSDIMTVEGVVTGQDMHDPTYLSILSNLGWNDNDGERSSSLLEHYKQKDSNETIESSFTHAPPEIPTKASRRTKAEIQRELLGLKRKALSLRRQGNTDEAEEVLETAKALEAEIAEMEAPKNVVDSKSLKEKANIPSHNGASEEEEEEVNVTENDMTDPALLSMLNNLGWKDEEVEPVTTQEEYSKNIACESLHSSHPHNIQPFSVIQVSPPRSKGEIQTELLGLKRKALAVRRNGQVEEAEELLQRAKVLEAEMAVLEATKSKLFLDSFKDSESGNFESFANHEKLGNLQNEVIVKKGSVAVVVGPSETVVESSKGLGRMESDADNLPLRSSDTLFTPPTTQDSLRQAVLSHKKKALALKRDGKLAEARENFDRQSCWRRV